MLAVPTMPTAVQFTKCEMVKITSPETSAAGEPKGPLTVRLFT